MKIKQLLEQEAQPDYAQIVQETSEFFGRTTGGLLFRGLQRELHEPRLVTPRTNRTPTDTSIDVHQVLDQAFHRRFGVRYRSNSIFATGDLSVARMYSAGDVAVALPVNGMRFCWSPEIDDLYEHMLRAMKDNAVEIPDEAERLDFCVEKALETYEQTNLAAAVNTGHEVMISSPVWLIPQQNLRNKDQIPAIRNQLLSYL